MRTTMSVKRSARGRQRGWSLVEAAMVVMLVGVMSTGLWKTMELVGKNSRGEQSRDVLQRAEDALYGMALRDLRLPIPDDAVISADNPRHLEGWLPENVLGTEPPRSIRYIVDQRLVTATTNLYDPDPMRLLGPDSNEDNLLENVSLLPPQTGGPNGLDLCLKVVQREREGLAKVDGANLMMGLQQTDSLDKSSGAARFQFGTNATPGADARGQLNTRTVGHLELIHRMGCMQGFARLTAEVKSAALFHDLYLMAGINRDLRALEVRAAGDFLRSHHWRKRVAITRLTMTVISTAANLVSMQTSPVGAAIGAANLSAMALLIVLWNQLIGLSQQGINANEAALPILKAAHQEAIDYAESMKQQRGWHLARINGFVSKGVAP